MLGGDNSIPVFPALLEQNQIHYGTNDLPQLHLFGDYAIGCDVSHLNYLGTEQHLTSTSRQLKRGRETEIFSRQQKLHMPVHNNSVFTDRGDHSHSILNQNQVSTGLKLSYEEDEHNNSSVTSASEAMTAAALPLLFSSSSNLTAEINRQREEFDHYIRVQEENIMKGLKEMKRRHTVTFLNAIERGVNKKLLEKDLEIKNMNYKNKELMERIKQASIEVQSWHHRAKYNESIVHTLKSNLNQVIAQHQGKEGCGDNEVDDAASHACSADTDLRDTRVKCSACKVKEVGVLLLPCRHLCFCVDCEGSIDVCPVCRVMKTASVQVFMS